MVAHPCTNSKICRHPNSKSFILLARQIGLMQIWLRLLKCPVWYKNVAHVSCARWFIAKYPYFPLMTSLSDTSKSDRPRKPPHLYKNGKHQNIAIWLSSGLRTFLLKCAKIRPLIFSTSNPVWPLSSVVISNW